jgi:hypothetical protein
MYFVNGFKFHTTSWGEGKTTYNSGVCVSGIGHDGTPNDYYGVVREILEFEWPCQETRKLLNSNINSFNPSPNHIHNLNTLNLTLYQLNLNRNHDLNPLNLTLCQINLNHNHNLNPFNLTLYQLNLNHNPLNLTICQINHYLIHLNILVDPSLLKLWSMKPHLPLAILVETPKLKFQYSLMGMGKSLTDILVNNDGYIKKLIFFGLKCIFSGLIPTN